MGEYIPLVARLIIIEGAYNTGTDHLLKGLGEKGYPTITAVKLSPLGKDERLAINEWVAQTESQIHSHKQSREEAIRLSEGFRAGVAFMEGSLLRIAARSKLIAFRLTTVQDFNRQAQALAMATRSQRKFNPSGVEGIIFMEEPLRQRGNSPVYNYSQAETRILQRTIRELIPEQIPLLSLNANQASIPELITRVENFMYYKIPGLARALT